MMRSLYSGISGLRNHQTRMDVLGNNIANVNTAGYKTSRVIFQDIFSQNVAAGMANTGNLGGTNPIQIGLGIKLSNVDVIHTRAAFQRTDKETDMMINGDGFFVVMQENIETGEREYLYTRAGNFDIDSEGYLVTSHGYFVMGYTVPLAMGMVSPGSLANDPPIDDPTNVNYKAPTFGLVAIGRPEANGEPGLEKIRVFSELYQAVNYYSAIATDPQITAADRATINGHINTILTNEAIDPPTPASLAAIDTAQQAIDTILKTYSIGAPPMFPTETVSLPGFMVAPNGDVSVIIANRAVTIGRIGLAMFANPTGLEKAGNSLYRETASSGTVVITEAFMDGAGKIDAGGLEMSNVDLADQFTDMIVTQRGFQANSRIITVSDTMLEELVNLKR